MDGVHDLNSWMLALANAIEECDDESLDELESKSRSWLQMDHERDAQLRLIEAARWAVNEIDY